METKYLLSAIKEAAFEVRLNLGPGYLESVYQNALMIELRSRGIYAEKESVIPVWYKGEQVGDFRADILVGKLSFWSLRQSGNLIPSMRPNW